jgi:hypothetical protein
MGIPAGASHLITAAEGNQLAYRLEAPFTPGGSVKLGKKRPPRTDLGGLGLCGRLQPLALPIGQGCGSTSAGGTGSYVDGGLERYRIGDVGWLTSPGGLRIARSMPPP